MFILKRQDVDIKTIQHPQKDQTIPILSYQGQTFRLLSVFTAAQEEEARALWRDLTDNRGKACVLLEEPDRYSIWGKVHLDMSAGNGGGGVPPAEDACILASLLLLQVTYIDVEDLLGNKQARSFEEDLNKFFAAWKFPQAETPKAVKGMLEIDPLTLPQLPPWQDHHLHRLLEEVHRLGKSYFGNNSFTQRSLEALEDLPSHDRATFQAWLKQSPTGKLWS